MMNRRGVASALVLCAEKGKSVGRGYVSVAAIMSSPERRGGRGRLSRSASDSDSGDRSRSRSRSSVPRSSRTDSPSADDSEDRVRWLERQLSVTTARAAALSRIASVSDVAARIVANQSAAKGAACDVTKADIDAAAARCAASDALRADLANQPAEATSRAANAERSAVVAMRESETSVRQLREADARAASEAKQAALKSQLALETLTTQFDALTAELTACRNETARRAEEDRKISALTAEQNRGLFARVSGGLSGVPAAQTPAELVRVNDALTKELDDLKEAYAALNRINDREHKSNATDFTRLRAENKRLKEESDEVGSINTVLRDEVARLKEQKVELMDKNNANSANFSRQLAVANGAITTIMETADGLRRQLDASKAQTAALQVKLEEERAAAATAYAALIPKARAGGV
jgi:hypothetical protein